MAYAKGVVDCTREPDTSRLKGKSVVITGGANGMGLEAVKLFAQADAFVTFCDVNEAEGKKVEAQLGLTNVNFVKADVTKWEDQVQVFNAAKAKSPHNSVDVVIANAGISGADILHKVDDSDEAVKPELSIVNIDLIGVMYTLKLARHYFARQPDTEERDRCFMITASLAGFMDLPESPQYTAAKWGCRGLMRCLRRTSVLDKTRYNNICPWFISSAIRPPQVEAYYLSKGISFCQGSDAARAMVYVASDKSINGRSLAILPREIAAAGFRDVDLDDYEYGDLLDTFQNQLIAINRNLNDAAAATAR
ncbi:hypothetical protein Z517_08392 [Fonsecaea pedrosoi CBS 271.37]|uniref:Unplaced genomic scaffold supercont1.5, whole genome shotgun sequence n=1 Tax=Fonsecaea pedrosoi CBS 271.37 TaxID=1442368 RepID=A0A0D2H1R5_9EURO|nr:uncharacterized protein Z517_08392 [Fonsecaea pedrosoi CBS 271.37]KIW78554.1 hypothetical protein Z517_08392 [Fonsecaea pedrosoi CBS 271.37]